MDELIVKILGACEAKPSPRQDDLCLELSAQAEEVAAALESLVAEGRLVRTRKGRYAPAESLGFLRGKIQGNERGFAFFLPEDGSPDLFVSPDDDGGALHGDVVLARRHKAHGRPCAQIVQILQHANAVVIGSFHADEDGAVVISEERRVTARFRVGKNRTMGAQEGEMVVLRVTRWPAREDEEPQGTIEEVLGPGGYATTDLRVVLRKHNLREDFPEEVQRAAAAIPQEVSPADLAGREDFRDQPCFTIDGPDARDFDDALFAEEIPGGIRLYVHIADVSHYVPFGSAIDREALERGTSVYLLDTVLPMLPTELSNGICSLNPGVDRLTFTCVMDVDGQSGEVFAYRLARGAIRSGARLVYDDVTAFLENGGPPHPQGETLRLLSRLREILSARRTRRGSVDFELAEAAITLDEGGVPLEVTARSRGVADLIVEECMLLANETVASYAVGLELPFLYRVHEPPDEEKMQSLTAFATATGYRFHIGKQGVFPKDLQTLLQQAKGRPEEAVLSRITLRTMQRARYAPQNLGHFGLALADYAHFTSPIRRYPDLFIHRMLALALRGEMTDTAREKLNPRAAEVAAQSSDREREAAEAEREWDDMKKAQYMLGHIGEHFEGIVAGLSAFGIFVELPNTVQGMVPVRSLPDDEYVYSEQEYRLVGRRTKQSIFIGDRMSVLCVGANPAAGRVDFAADTESPHRESYDAKNASGGPLF